MSYQELLTYLYGLGRFGMKPGTERILQLLAALGNPQESFTSVHIAGTNGKGSTASFLSCIMTRAGYRTGLFTSPHLTHFSERIRIDGHELSEAELLHCGERVVAAAPPGATFFELVTGMALLAFAEQGVSVAVLEAGMGGRFDATGAVSGVLTVITSVGLDHCQYLGDSVPAIAADKAGIIRADRPVVTAVRQHDALREIERVCTVMGSSLYRIGEQFSAEWSGTLLDYTGLNISLSSLDPGIGGRYQASNVACALAATELLARAGFAADEMAMREGIATATWPGRMELMGEAPRVLLDGAHNADGARALADELTFLNCRRICLVVGVMGDKDATEILRPLLPRVDAVYAVAPSLERSMPADKLASLCSNLGVTALAADSVADGIARARVEAGPDGLVVVCGSLFTVGEARALIAGRMFEQYRG
jgi:dihydrofolate synthase/folylpolyglutamate synthase